MRYCNCFVKKKVVGLSFCTFITTEICKSFKKKTNIRKHGDFYKCKNTQPYENFLVEKQDMSG